MTAGGGKYEEMQGFPEDPRTRQSSGPRTRARQAGESALAALLAGRTGQAWPQPWLRQAASRGRQDRDGVGDHMSATSGLSGRIQPSVRMMAVPPEARGYQGQRAGLVSRLLASGVDLVAVAGTVGVGYLAVSAVIFLWDPSRFRFPAPDRTWPLAAGGANRSVADVVLRTSVVYAWGGDSFPTGERRP